MTSIAQPGDSVEIPVRALAPHVSQWLRLSAASSDERVQPVGTPDPFVRHPRPAWADPDGWDGTLQPSDSDYRWWRSPIVHVPYPSARHQDYLPGGEDGFVLQPSIGVTVKQAAVDGTTFIDLTRHTGAGEEATALVMRPATARRIAHALLAAVELVEPDADFDGADGAR
jgi:hypothetical protein